MSDLNFVERVKKYFTFLELEFGFKISVAKNSEVRSLTDGMIKYITDNSVILIDSETGYVTVRFARIVDGEKYYLTPVDIHEYLYTSNMEKELLLSTNPEDQSAASVIFNKIFLLNQPGWKGNEGNIEGLEKELVSFSNWMKKHADLCLRGDFSNWPQLYEYKIYRTRADLFRRGKDEIGYARVKDSDGNWKLIRQSIFKDKLDYIEKLKKEFSK